MMMMNLLSSELRRPLVYIGSERDKVMSRQGYDLFNRHGRRVFFRELNTSWRLNPYMWRDTFGRFICLFKKRHVFHDYGPEYVPSFQKSHCIVCNTWIQVNLYLPKGWERKVK